MIQVNRRQSILLTTGAAFLGANAVFGAA